MRSAFDNAAATLNILSGSSLKKIHVNITINQTNIASHAHGLLCIATYHNIYIYKRIYISILCLTSLNVLVQLP